MENNEDVLTNYSTTPSKSICEILTYEELAVTAEWLLHDTLNLSDDFQMKNGFACDQQKQITENDDNIIDLLNNVANLKITIGELEVETKLLSQTLDECSKTVDQLLKINGLQKQQENVTDQTCCGCVHRSEREMCLQMLIDTDSAVANLDGLSDDLQELKIYTELEQSRNPYKNICDIIQCHCETLQNTEKNLDIMMDKMAMIDRYFYEMCQKKNSEWA